MQYPPHPGRTEREPRRPNSRVQPTPRCGLNLGAILEVVSCLRSSRSPRAAQLTRSVRALIYFTSVPLLFASVPHHDAEEDRLLPGINVRVLGDTNATGATHVPVIPHQDAEEGHLMPGIIVQSNHDTEDYRRDTRQYIPQQEAEKTVSEPDILVEGKSRSRGIQTRNTAA